MVELDKKLKRGKISEMLFGKVELVKERDGAEFLLKPLGFFLFLLLVVN